MQYYQLASNVARLATATNITPWHITAPHPSPELEKVRRGWSRFRLYAGKYGSLHKSVGLPPPRSYDDLLEMAGVVASRTDYKSAGAVHRAFMRDGNWRTRYKTMLAREAAHCQALAFRFEQASAPVEHRSVPPGAFPECTPLAVRPDAARLAVLDKVWPLLWLHDARHAGPADSPLLALVTGETGLVLASKLPMHHLSVHVRLLREHPSRRLRDMATELCLKLGAEPYQLQTRAPGQPRQARRLPDGFAAPRAVTSDSPAVASAPAPDPSAACPAAAPAPTPAQAGAHAVPVPVPVPVPDTDLGVEIDGLDDLASTIDPDAVEARLGADTLAVDGDPLLAALAAWGEDK